MASFHEHSAPAGFREVETPLTGMLGMVQVPARGIVRHQSPSALALRKATTFYRLAADGYWASNPSWRGPGRIWRLGAQRPWHKRGGTMLQKYRRWYRWSRAEALRPQLDSLAAICSPWPEREVIPALPVGEAEWRRNAFQTGSRSGHVGQGGDGFVSRSTLGLAGIHGERIDVVVNKPVGKVRYELAAGAAKDTDRAAWRKAKAARNASFNQSRPLI